MFRIRELGGSRHKRRGRYWRLYDFAHSRELSEVLDELARLVDEVEDPWPKPKRGHRPVHSTGKMAVTCVLTVVLGFSYRRMEALYMCSGFLGRGSLFQTTAPSMKLSEECLNPT